MLLSPNNNGLDNCGHTSVALPALVIPDVHQNFERAEEIVAAHGTDCASVVFLGDYLDSRECRSLEALRATLVWLRASLRDPRRTHLLGNHDLAYVFCARDTFCTGWNDRRQDVFNEVIGTELAWMRENMHLAIQAGPWVLSHAGFGPKCRDASVDQLLAWAGHAHRALPRLGGRGPVHCLNGCGRSRGGYQSEGGLTWLDWLDEFQPLPGIHQLVGHTSDVAPRYRHLNCEGHLIAGKLAPQNFPRSMTACGFRSVNWCLDAGLRAWAVVHFDRLEVHYDGQVVVCSAPELGHGARRFLELEAFGLPVEVGEAPPLSVSVAEISRLLGVKDLRSYNYQFLPDLSLDQAVEYIDSHTPELVREFKRRLGSEFRAHANLYPHGVNKALRALRRRGLLNPQPRHGAAKKNEE
jgi:hypothetical protein